MEASLSEIETSMATDARARQEAQATAKTQSISRLRRFFIVWQQAALRRWLYQLRLSFKQQSIVVAADRYHLIIVALILLLEAPMLNLTPMDPRLDQLRQMKETGEHEAATHIKAAEDTKTALMGQLAEATRKLCKYDEWLKEATERMLVAEKGLREEAAHRRLEQQGAEVQAAQMAMLAETHRVTTPSLSLAPGWSR